MCVHLERGSAELEACLQAFALDYFAQMRKKSLLWRICLSSHVQNSPTKFSEFHVLEARY